MIMDDKSKKTEPKPQQDAEINKGVNTDLNESYIPDFNWTPAPPPTPAREDEKQEEGN